MFTVIQISEMDGPVNAFGPYDSYAKATEVVRELLQDNGTTDPLLYSYDILPLSVDHNE